MKISKYLLAGALLFSALSAEAYTPPQTATSPITLSGVNVIACPTCAISGGAITLGTSASVANPQRSGDATTGLYTAGAAEVDVTISGTKRIAWTSTGEAITGILNVSGNSTLSGSANSVGTITTGVWNAGAVTSSSSVTGLTGAFTSAVDIINASGNAVLTTNGHEVSGGGSYMRVRDDVLGTVGYFGQNSAINGGTAYSQFSIQNPQTGGTVCLSANGTSSSTAGTNCDLLINASDNVVATGTIQGTRLISTIATGTAPFTVTSTTQVANLNAATAGAFSGNYVASLATSAPLTGGAAASNAAALTVACATCATTTNGGALSGTSPISVSAAGVISITSPLPVANGGTNAASASITAFNNITGYSASGATGTTSTNLVFSTGATLVTPTLGAATATSIVFSPTTSGIIGTTTNDSATTGKVGEYVSSYISGGSPVNVATATSTNLTSISLTAGDWDVHGQAFNTLPNTKTMTLMYSDLSTTSATYNLDHFGASTWIQNTSVGDGSSAFSINPNVARFSLSTTTTVYLVVYHNANATCPFSGGIWARRVR